MGHQPFRLREKSEFCSCHRLVISFYLTVLFEDPIELRNYLHNSLRVSHLLDALRPCECFSPINISLLFAPKPGFDSLAVRFLHYINQSIIPGTFKVCLSPVMKVELALRYIILLQFSAMVALGQGAHQSDRSLLAQPSAPVRSLYGQVVVHHPLGIPKGVDMKPFAPYLSKSLLYKIDVALACENDYYRQRQNPTEKPEIEWLEFGLFTGGNEKAEPRLFHIERTQSEKDGSSRVNVRLTWGAPSKPWIWRVAAIVVQEDRHFVIDDVIFLKDDETLDVESRLSEILTAGCNGSHWIGYSK